MLLFKLPISGFILLAFCHPLMFLVLLLLKFLALLLLIGIHFLLLFLILLIQFLISGSGSREPFTVGKVVRIGLRCCADLAPGYYQDAVGIHRGLRGD